MNRECFRPCKNISLGAPVLHIKYVFYAVLSCCQDKWSLLVICLHISLTKRFFVLFSCVDKHGTFITVRASWFSSSFLNEKERRAYIMGMQNCITLSQKARHLKSAPGLPFMQIKHIDLVEIKTVNRELKILHSVPSCQTMHIK